MPAVGRISRAVGAKNGGWDGNVLGGIRVRRRGKSEEDERK
jgi:hypothetical protein